jgi:L-fuculose-phosphate aldolase
MGNHGAVVVAGTLAEALSLAGYLEYVCEVHLRALGTGLPVRTVPAAELARVAGRLGDYGQVAPDLSR